MDAAEAFPDLDRAARIAGGRALRAIQRGRSVEALRWMRAHLMVDRMRRDAAARDARLRLADRSVALRRPQIPATPDQTAPAPADAPAADLHDLHYLHPKFSSPAHCSVLAGAIRRRRRRKTRETARAPP